MCRGTLASPLATRQSGSRGGGGGGEKEEGEKGGSKEEGRRREGKRGRESKRVLKPLESSTHDNFFQDTIIIRLAITWVRNPINLPCRGSCS